MQAKTRALQQEDAEKTIMQEFRKIEDFGYGKLEVEVSLGNSSKKNVTIRSTTSSRIILSKNGSK